ncbi:hypothetical protein K1719_011991 [Acacia pycnantha]|nr:hypothetical protein K1719_011991 [Acacia pycnantha]
MRIKTRAPKGERPTFLKQKRKRADNIAAEDRGILVWMRDVLLTFRAHLHLLEGDSWTENVLIDMGRYHELLSENPATVPSLRSSWARYSLQYGLIKSLREFGISNECFAWASPSSPSKMLRTKAAAEEAILKELPKFGYSIVFTWFLHIYSFPPYSKCGLCLQQNCHC